MHLLNSTKRVSILNSDRSSRMKVVDPIIDDSEVCTGVIVTGDEGLKYIFNIF